MSRLLWILLRFSLCAWIGAASLFVVTGVREVTSELFDPATKNQLAALRFPAFYLFGFGLVGAATVAASVLSLKDDDGRKRVFTVFALVTAVFATMVVDYFWIYMPLEEMMSQPDARSRPEFASYHGMSKWINIASLTVCFVAALMSLGDRSSKIDNGSGSP